jgi:tRNA pseudouridine55 synthase
MHAGIINLLKPPGFTSHDCVQVLRRLLNMKKIGHGGTLDPGACGVLPICLGNATRLSDWFHLTGKTYRVEMTLGIQTDTFDAAGQTTQTDFDFAVPPSRLGDAIFSFLGTFMQVPPQVSSIQVQGKRAYKLASSGIKVDLPPREVIINSISIKKIWTDDVYLRFGTRVLLEVDCSKGTYMRSLCHDMGEILGCGAHLSFLVRTRSGPLKIEESVSFPEIEEFIAKKDFSFILPMDTAVSHLPRVDLSEEQTLRVVHGNSILLDECEYQNQVRLHDPVGKFVAIGRVKTEKDRFVCYPEKVFI